MHVFITFTYRYDNLNESASLEDKDFMNLQAWRMVQFSSKKYIHVSLSELSYYVYVFACILCCEKSLCSHVY